MIKKFSAAMAAAALLAASPAIAQASAPVQPAAETVEGENALSGDWGAGTYIIGAIVIGLVAWGIWELVDDNDDDEPVSP